MDNEKYLQDIFNKKENWRLMNNYLQLYQIPENILIKTIDYYDSNLCLKTQHNLKRAFCFNYLYNKESDMEDNKVDYNDIIAYYKYKL